MVLIESSRQICAVALRQKVAPGTGLPQCYTTLPVVPTNLVAGSLLLPQIADGEYPGGRVRTSFLLLNPSPTSAVLTVEFTDDEGKNFKTRLGELREASSLFTVPRPPHGSAFLTTQGTGDTSFLCQFLRPFDSSPSVPSG